MGIYLLKFSACLLVFWLIYVLFLERQSMHFTKRIYLLGALALAFSIPLMTITKYVEPVTRNIETLPSANIPFEAIDEQVAIQESFWNLEHILWIIYGLGVLVFTIRFILNIYKMYERIFKNKRLTKPPFIYILLKERRIPHSFFRYLFFNEMAYQNQEIPKEVVKHEETHARQWHTLDILILELVQIVLWFHPLVYMLKHHIKLNHEFLADQAVINEVEDTKTYQNILLQFSSSTQNYELSSAINYSSFKKRFTVMKTQTSKTKIWLSSLLILPIIAILFYSFAEREYVKKEIENTYLSKVKPKSPTILQFESWKNENEFAVWIDGKHVSNSKLNDYKASDIVHFVGSKVHENARSEKFPQPFQYSLYTRQGFQKSYQESAVNAYKELTKTYSDAIKEYLKGPQTNNSELKILYAQASKLHNQFSEAELKKHDILMPPPVPAQNKQNPPTQKEISDYNTWAKPINKKMAQSEKKAGNEKRDYYPIVKAKEVNKYKAIYDRMTEAQRKNAEPWPNFPPPLPPAPPAPERATVIEIAEYDVWAKKMNAAIKKAESGNIKSYYPRIKKEDYDKYYNIYSNLMTEAQRESAEPWPNIPPPPPPPAPEPPKPPKVEKNEYGIPPPPPPPMSKEAKGNLNEYHVNAYNEWMKHIRSENPNPKLMAMEVYNYYRDLYNALTEKQKKMTDGLPPPPPPPSPKPNKTLEKEMNNSVENVNQKQKAHSKKVIDAYSKKHPESVSKVKINDEIVEVVEIPSDQEGTTEIYGEEYKYIIKDGETTYYDSSGKEYNEDEFKQFILELENSIPTPPPPPKSAYEFVKSLKDDDITYYFKDKKVSYEEILKIIKYQPKLSMHTNIQDNKGYVKFWIEE